MSNNILMSKNIRQSVYQIDPTFLNRWSPRSFSEKQIPEETLLSIFEAARWAPSAANAQPWRFIVGRTSEELEKFYSVLFEGNLAWCKKAPALALILSKKTFNEKQLRSHAFDTGSAWGFLALEASKKGLITHAMGGFDVEKAREVFNVPNEYDIHVIVAIGYQGEIEDLPNEALQQREQPSDRIPLNEVLFEGSFGKSLK